MSRLLSEIATTRHTTQSTLYVVAGVVVDVVLCHTYICATSDEKIWVDPVPERATHCAHFILRRFASHEQKSLADCPMLR